MHDVTIAIGLVAGVVVLVWLAKRTNIPYPILLVLGGLALGFVPGLPRIQMRPDLVFLVFLPPLLFQESWGMSWRDFRRNIRPISLLAVGLVLATTAAVAAVAHFLIPGLSWPVGFVLGSIIAPTDELAAMVVAERLSIPRRIITVIVDESLVNDASSLVIFRLATAAVVAGSFSLLSGAFQFIFIIVAGIAIGLAIGWVAAKVLDRLEDPSIEITASLLVPYFSYLIADHVNASGVLAVIATGLYLGRRAVRTQSARTHIEAEAFWDMLAFILNGVLFFLTGLQLRAIVDLGAHSLLSLIGYAAVISLVVIVVRIAWVFPEAYLPRILSARIRKSDPTPPWQQIAILAWTGVRGAVSLAAALAIPLTVSGGAPFPDRGLIIFITFGVILATLVLQGLSLPVLIQKLGVHGDRSARHEENKARLAAARAGLERLEQIQSQGRAPQKVIDEVRGHLERHARLYGARIGGETDGAAETYHEAYYWLRDDLLRAQTDAVIELRDKGAISDEVLHRVQHELDLESLQLDGNAPMESKAPRQAALSSAPESKSPP